MVAVQEDGGRRRMRVRQRQQLAEQLFVAQRVHERVASVDATDGRQVAVALRQLLVRMDMVIKTHLVQHEQRKVSFAAFTRQQQRRSSCNDRRR